MVGMGAVVNDNAVVGESAFVAAMAFVKAGMQVPPRTLVAGIPAKVMRDLSADELAWKLDATRTYQNLARRSLASLRETVALTEEEPGRKRLASPSLATTSASPERQIAM
jgi:phenylacetic acid degradation protein